MAETLAELQKQKEDINILLSTLEEAFKEASITEEHYKEVRGKNQKKLEEIVAKIENLEKEAVKKAEKEEKKAKQAEKKAAKKAKAAKPKKPKKEPKPPAEPSPAAPPATPPATPPAETPPATPEQPPEGGGEGEYSGVPQPLTDIAGEGEAIETKPDKAPSGVRRGQPGTLQYTAEEIKEMFTKILKEIKPQGIEVGPRVDKLEVQLEKIRAYIDSMKDERSSGKENLQRLTEELGELRSNLSNLDRKTSESEIKVGQVDEALGDLRPQRFLKAMREQDSSIKMHEARLDKMDDMTSAMLKKLGQIEEVLKRLGSLEKIVNFSKEAAKRLLEIENREKRIGRIADKIDGIFMELNKRLDEFVLYKAKQDTLDELSQEMMKSLDEANTKMQKYAEKTDLDNFRDTIETELASIRAGSGASPEVQKLQSQKTEIEGLVAMLDEQFKSGAIKEAEYKKTRQINLDRLKDLDSKITQVQSAPAEAPATPAAPAGDKPAEPAKTDETTATPAPEPTAETAPEPGKPAAKPKAEKPEPKPDKQRELMSELEDSLMKGLISKEAYDKAKKMVKKQK